MRATSYKLGKTTIDLLVDEMNRLWNEGLPNRAFDLARLILERVKPIE